MGIFSRGPYCLAKPTASWLSLFKDTGWSRAAWAVAAYCSFLAAMVFVPSVAQAQTDAERAALVAIYDATDGDNWADTTNWKSQEPVGTWHGVTVRDGVVTELDLDNNNLTGMLPSEIGDLTNLIDLYLDDNSLSGAIPSEIGNLTSLVELSLGGNFTGAIPTEIGNLTILEELSLGGNFTGAIPTEIGNLTNLRWLGLGGNFTGAIPTEIGNLTKLEELWLEDNSLTGSIPAEIGNLISLTNLQLHSNSLTGSIPAEIGNLINLKALDLSQNSLSGAIPSEIGNLTILRSLGLWNNSLTGSIPVEIENLISLRSLQLHSNSLTGAIPAEIGNLISLERLLLNDNTALTGELPAGLRLLPINYLDIRETCITTPADSDFQAWLAGITFYDTDRVCAAGVTVTPTALSVPEGSNAKYTVVLDAQPSADVTISLSFASGSDEDITVDKTSLTFTTDNWNEAQEVTVSAAEDNDATDGVATIAHTASGGGYGSVTVSSVTATESDNDTAGVMVTPTALSVPEGSNAKYTVVLDAQPSADVMISLSFASGSDADITVDKTSLTFTTDKWDTSQEVTVSAAEDMDTANGAATIEHTVSGGDYAGVTASDVTVTEADNDTPGVAISPTTLTITEGASKTYEVVLNTQPTGDVTVTPSLATGSDEDVTLASSVALIFTMLNWNVAQTVTVNAAEDNDTANGVATIEHTVSGGDYAGVTASDVTVTEADNDNDADAERAALVALYDATGGNNWTDNTNWKSQEPVGNWYGVTVESGAVTELNLTANSLNGEIPSEIGDLSGLEELWLGNNALSGSIPAEIGDLISLTLLDLSTNALSGSIPAEIGNLTSLERLWLENNRLSGEIPEGIGNLTSLERLDLRSNNLSGTIPAEIGGLTSLELLSISGNFLSGTIPAEIGNLTSLRDLRLHVNRLSGSIPAEIENLSSLEILELAYNTELTGALPAGLRFLPITLLDIRETCITTPADSDFQTWLAGITFYDTDRVCAVGVTVTPTTLSVPEGSNAQYTVVLDTQPSTDVTISLSLASGSDEDITVDKTSLTFTPENWNAAQEVTVSAAEDDDATDGAATIEHAASGGGYGGVSVSSVTATEADNDKDAVGVTVTPTALTVAEGDSVKYTVVLTTEPSDNVTISVSLASGSDEDITVDKTSLTFTTDNWDTAQEVTVSAAEDDDATDGAATIEHAASGGGYGGVSVSSVTATEADNDKDAVGVTVTPMSLTVAEGDSVKYTVALTTQPSDNVTIAVSRISDSNADITVSPASLTFTTENWSTAQEMTVRAAEDDNALNGTATIEHTASGGGYDGVSVSSVTVTELDNDTRGVTVTPTTLTVAEGDSAKYTVVLTTEPSDNVTISLSFASGSDEDITVDKTSLTFTTDNWNVAQEVTVSAAEDDDAINGAATIEHAASGGGYGGVSVSSVTATEADNDKDAVGVTVTPMSLTVAEGDSVKYTVALTTQPSDNVTIAVSRISDSNADITVSPASLTFTTENWSTAQEMTVRAAEDDNALNGTATIEHTASGGGYDGVSVSSVTVTELDNDTRGVTVTPTTLTVAEGDSAKYTVVLTTEPSDNVTISLSFASGSDEDITVDKTSLTFTTDNWNVAQEVTVSAAEDDDAINGAATIEHAASGGGYGGISVSSVTATEADNDAVGVTVTPTALTVPEGSNVKYSVALDTQPSEDVTISLSFASGSDADITVDKTSLTFTLENWDAAQEVTVSAAEDDDAVNGAATIEHSAAGGDYGGVTVSSVTATEADNDTPDVTVMPTTLTVPEGGSATYTVVLDTEPSAGVTISLSFASGSDEDITVDKTSLTFTTENWNAAQEVTVSAAVDNDVDDDAALLNHNASGGDYSEVIIADVAIEVIDEYGGIDVSGWLARYTRAGADHLLSSVQNRMERVGRGVSGAQASVAGQRIVFGDSPAQPGMELSGASAIWSASQHYMTRLSLGERRRAFGKFVRDVPGP